jgi:hypothetical protein
MRNAVAALLIALVFTGCCSEPQWMAPSECPQQPGFSQQPIGEQVPAPTPGYANPVWIPVADPQAAWELVVGVVGSYFRIEREEPIRQVGNVVMEGRITTVPEVSPTIFEPWRHDTVDPEQRVENTLQTMRRRAVVRVIPAQGGHWVDVTVFKDLEDLARPEKATAGAATFRYDSTSTRISNPVAGDEAPLGWIYKGRDASMEQHLITHLMSQTGQAGYSNR